MAEILKQFIIPLLLIAAGILLKKDLLPNTKNIGKLWLLLIVVGCMSLALQVILIIIRS